MKLDKTQIGKIIHNVINYDLDENGALHFRRFQDSQLASYENEAHHWVVRANASASVTFDFLTDSEYLALKFDLFPGSSKLMASFDLYIDGVFFEHTAFDNLDAKLISFALPEGQHRVTLYFPWTAETVVNEVHLSDGASIKEITKKRKVIFLGDSITQGYVTEFPSLSYVNQVANDTDSEVLNQGIGGYYFGANSIDESLASFNPDLIVIAYGTNDYSKHDSKEVFEASASTYIEKLTAIFPNTKMLAVLPIYRNDENHNARERYREYTLSDAREILAGIYGKYENIRILTETGIPRIPEVFVADFLHPNELGFSFMAKSIGKEISKWQNK